MPGISGDDEEHPANNSASNVLALVCIVIFIEGDEELTE